MNAICKKNNVNLQGFHRSKRNTCTDIETPPAIVTEMTNRTFLT